MKLYKSALTLALLAAGQLSPLLMGVNPWDPAVHFVGIALIVTIAMLACWSPARRAAGLDPSQSLRRE